MLAYTDIGSGDKTIVFIHGLGSRKEYWKKQHELASTYRLIIPDLRGHGKTKYDKNISMYNFARDVIKLLEHLEIKEAFICGLSLGGLVAQEIHIQRPDMVSGLILADTTTYIPPTILPDPTKFVNDEQLIDAVVKASLFDKSFVEEAKEGFYIRSKYHECIKAPMGVNYTDDLLKVYKPILIICGIHDKVTPIYQSWSMYMMTCNSRFETLVAGHLSNIEKPKEFNQSIDNFIKEVV